jgi:hypothetical protein
LKCPICCQYPLLNYPVLNKGLVFTEESVEAIMENARNRQFDLAHVNLIEKIMSSYSNKRFRKTTETLQVMEDRCLLIAGMRRHFNVIKYVMENSFDSL